ncbi:WD40 repeat-like protein [Amniculicola lignicola CBS 123094]|uniref:WD40 repeat-like protein n=1 Tax=Amniculicola lignicola CBS 123094 TaxID=1392246 RepID=A0A6A5X4S3_9PLEO|nr:WD40 repeat-like protein [Amniculicola lignicola CBS 123094]
MFRWYQNAAKCYVYLSDVSALKRKSGGDDLEQTWEPAFRASRWFTRGWTLQELLAPVSVEFFSLEWKNLGDKLSLKQQIQRVTGIPESALQGTRLSQFSVNERLLWKENRHTKFEEDKAYSLLGIFGVYIAPIYGEGAAEAFRRLLSEVDKLEKCTQDLHLTDARDDKRRIEDIKGGLLEDSYRWVLETTELQQWRSKLQNRILWVKGDPGKGKTMLLCGIINDLEKSLARTEILSYFFCQATDSRINNATAVLRGLLYMLVAQQPSLVSHIRKKHDHAGKAVFEGANAWFALSEIFTNMLEDPIVDRMYLVTDALDECITDLPKLLDLVVQRSSVSSRVKWIVSSRNLPDIEEQLAKAIYGVRLNLELNTQSISTAVNSYVRYKADQLAERRRYDDKTRHAVLEHLISNAQGTFLWVALVCQALEGVSKWNVMGKLKTFPPGLDELYERMMKQISTLDGAELSKQILAVAATVYRPITLKELATFVGQIEDEASDPDIIELVGYCGSFLTLRGNTVYFVHQSAKDFICAKASHEIFPAGCEKIHGVLLSRSLQVMSSAALHRDMYDLRRPGCFIEEVKLPDSDPLAALRYTCTYWIDHLCDCNFDGMPEAQAHLQKGGAVEVFLSTKYLYWLEALSLCQAMSKGVMSMAQLAGLAQERADAFASLTELIYDAHRFIMYHKVTIEKYPLQTYASVLLSSPTRSLIRLLFQEDMPTWVTVTPGMKDEWDACLQTLEGHTQWLSSVAFSHDSKQLASASYQEVKIWDVVSGQCLHTLEAHGSTFCSVDFSHDSKRLATLLLNGTVYIWNAIDGKCLRTLEWPAALLDSTDLRGAIKFSHDSSQLVCNHFSKLAVWNVRNGKCLHLLEGGGRCITSVSLSDDSKLLAAATMYGSVRIWNVDSGDCLKTLNVGHGLRSAAFLDNSTRILALKAHSSRILNWESGELLEMFGNSGNSLAVSHDTKQFAIGTYNSLEIYNISTGECIQVLQGHSGCANSVSFSHDSLHIASASFDTTVKIWDLSRSHVPRRHDGSNTSRILVTAFSHDSTHLAIAQRDTTVKIWDAKDGKQLPALVGSHKDKISSMKFSLDSTQLASGSMDGVVKLWDIDTGNCLQRFDHHHHHDIPMARVVSMAFSPCSTRLASTSRNAPCKVWDTKTGKCVWTIDKAPDRLVTSENNVAFSHDSIQLALALGHTKTVEIWDINRDELIKTIEHDNGDVDDGICSVAFGKDSKWLATRSLYGEVRIWDANSGERLQSFKSNLGRSQMSFDATSSYLYTDLGIIDIDATLSPTNMPRTENGLPQARYRGFSIWDAWITYRSENLLRLSGFSPLSVVCNIGEDFISIYDESQRLLVYKFDLGRLNTAIGKWR